MDVHSSVLPSHSFMGSSAGVNDINNRAIWELIVLVVVWYLCAVVTITTTKEVMNRVRLPFLLCLSQFVFASLFSYAYLRWTKKIRAVPANAKSVVLQISLSYTLGFIFTNIAFSLGTASSVETIKAAEPITTVLTGLIILQESYSRYTYLSLVPICGGVALACYNNDAFQFWCFALAMASNFGFSARAVFTKILNASQSGSFDEVNLFYAISWRGLVFLLPITALMEGQTLLGLIDSNIQPSVQSLSSQIDFPVLGALLVLNGTMFAMYNLASYAVLRRTELVTHAVLNVFRRVFIIVFTSLYFQVELTMLSIVGIGVATLGVLLFSVLQRLDKNKMFNVCGM